jgi:hypothetical protein
MKELEGPKQTLLDFLALENGEEPTLEAFRNIQGNTKQKITIHLFIRSFHGVVNARILIPLKKKAKLMFTSVRLNRMKLRTPARRAVLK